MDEEKFEQEYSIEINTKEGDYINNIKLKRNVDNNDLITWKEILVSTMDAIKGMGYSIPEDTQDAIKDAIDYYD